MSGSSLPHFCHPEVSLPASDHAAVEKLAYLKWQEAGSPQGEDLRFWNDAERELAAAELASQSLAVARTEMEFDRAIERNPYTQQHARLTAPSPADGLEE